MSTQHNFSSAAIMRKIGYALVPLLLGAGAALALLVVASRPASKAYAATLHYPGCASTIQGCIEGASPGDAILINTGKHSQSSNLGKAAPD